MREELVSVVVVTYNFENIIMDCLKSIENQTYKNLEVIIADDYSKDNTIEVCKRWKEKNINRFKRIEIIEVNKNNGVSKNVNNGIKLAKGIWTKLIAGDDYLDEKAIENLMSFKENDKNCEIIFSKVKTFIEKNNKKQILEILPTKEGIEFFNLETQKQLELILEANRIVAPSSFFKTSMLKKMNYFDERFRMVEDYPFWVKLLKNNVKFYFMPEVTVYYRQSANSVSGIEKNKKYNKTIVEFEKQFYKLIYKKNVKNKMKLWDKKLELLRKDLVLKNNNKSSLITQMIRYLEFKNLKKYIFRIVSLLIILKIILKIWG